MKVGRSVVSSNVKRQTSQQEVEEDNFVSVKSVRNRKNKIFLTISPNGIRTQSHKPQLIIHTEKHN